MIFHRPETEKRLFCPGPTPVPLKARFAAIHTSPYHRTDEFYRVFINCSEILGKFLDAEHAPLILNGSGTAAMEAAVVNFTEAGDRVLVLNCGKFGERWQELVSAFGCEPVICAAPWGKRPEIEEIRQLMKASPGIRAVFLQGTETSTAVRFPVREIAAMLRQDFPEALLIVDAVSSFGAEEIRLKEWGLDVVVACSQKALGIPPGLSFLAMSERARRRFSGRPRFYFDLRKEAEVQREGQSAFTPAISLILALESVLESWQQQGFSAVLERAATLAVAVRLGLKAMGLELLAEQSPSDALTAAYFPPGSDGKALIRELRERYGMVFAGGQGQLAGRIVRIAHFGGADPADLAAGLLALEYALFPDRFPSDGARGAAAFWAACYPLRSGEADSAETRR
ncbi:MAG: alanine--glyoxylate aminotransferase family protein [Deltaproteobacteria bacterium]|nr:alanine--glyoxylate aminotransferase family protein [Deltaproteobacteria bacterium]